MATVLFRCHVGHRASFCKVCSLPNYTLGKELCSFILLAYANYSAALAMATRLFPENHAAHLSKLLFPT